MLSSRHTGTMHRKPQQLWLLAQNLASENFWQGTRRDCPVPTVTEGLLAVFDCCWRERVTFISGMATFNFYITQRMTPH